MNKQSKMLRKFISALFISVNILGFFFLSCKQKVESGSRNLDESKITVSVAKGEHVEKIQHSSFSLTKGETLGLTDVLGKIGELKFEEGWEISKICLTNANGKEITEEVKHTFNSNSTIFIVSKRKSTKPILVSLKVNENSVSKISKNMNAGVTKKEKVKITAKVSPNEANITFNPKLEDDYLSLNIGQNALTITVSKGTESAIYTLNIERVEEATPVLKKLTIGSQIREGAEITTDRPIGIGIPYDAEFARISVETEPENAKVTFSANVNAIEGKVTLNTLSYSTNVKITVGEGAKAIEYNIILKKVVSGIVVYGGRIQGVQTSCTKKEASDLQNHLQEKDFVINGPYAKILVTSSIVESMSFVVNEIPSTKYDLAGFKSACFAKIPLGDKGETVDVSLVLKAVDNSVTEKFNFRLKRGKETVDVPCNELIIAGKSVILNNDEVFENLWKSPPLTFTGSEPTQIEVQSEKDMSVVIDGKPSIEAQTKKIENKDVWYAVDSISGVDGREIVVVASPKDTSSYHDVVWRFNLAYKAPKTLKVDYEINGKDEWAVPQEFKAGLNTEQNPLINIDGTHLNLKLAIHSEVASIKIGNENIQGNTLEKVIDGSVTYYILRHSTKLGNETKQIEIEITPSDLAVYAKKTIKFRAKGSGGLEKIDPKFVAIGDDKNLSKPDFIDKLENDKPSYKLTGDVARLVISLTPYEKEFLLDKITVNGDEASITKKTDTQFHAWYEATKDVDLGKEATKDVIIQFVPKTGVAQSLKWEFKLERGGTKPSLPLTDITWFKVWCKGGSSFGGGNPDFHNKLLDGSYKFEVDKEEVTIELGGLKATDPVKEAEFKMDGTSLGIVKPIRRGIRMLAIHKLTLPDGEDHNIEIIAYPNDEEKYSPLVYRFILQKK